MKGEELRNAVISPHAAYEIQRRRIPKEAVRAVLDAPEQWFEVRPGRIVVQSRIAMDRQGKT